VLATFGNIYNTSATTDVGPRWEAENLDRAALPFSIPSRGTDDVGPRLQCHVKLKTYFPAVFATRA